MTDSIFWALKKDGICSYLMGTIHVHDRRLFGIQAAVTPYIGQCVHFATELDFDDIEDRSAVIQPTYLPFGETLDHLLSRNDLKRLGFWLMKKAGMKAEQVFYMNPITVIGLLSGKSFEVGPSLDQQLFTKAKEAGLQCGGLESLEEQMAVLIDIPNAIQAQYLAKVLRSFSGGLKSERAMLQHYLDGNARQLYQSVRQQSGGMRKIMIYDRNKRMAERFSEIAEKQPIFAAVGAAHLHGKFGMLRSLKQEGFQLRPIRLNHLISLDA